MKNKFLILFAFLALGLMSCDLGEDPDPGGTATEALAGEYFVQLLSAPGGDLYIDYSMWTIANTAANSNDRVRVIDHEHAWGFNSVFNADVNSLTFSGDAAANPLYNADSPSTSPYQAIGTLDTVDAFYPKFMSISNGQLFLGAAHVPSGTVADSIAFSATATYYSNVYRVVSHAYDTVSMEPLEIDTLSVFQFVEEFEAGADGPYFLTGFRRTGFLEDEH